MSDYLKCTNCGQVFHYCDANKHHTTWESHYGVSDLFPNSNAVTFVACPHCDSEEVEEIYVSHCTSCEEPILDKEYEFFGEYYCLNCLMDILPNSKQLLEDYIKDSCSYLLKKFHSYCDTKDAKEIISLLAKEDTLFIEDYLLFLEEQVEDFKEKDIKDLDYHCYSQLCACCEDERRCHEDCTNCEEYLDFLEMLEALEELKDLS